MSNVYAVVMAGGRGERFWPLSTEQCSKPFIALLGPNTLIQETVRRLLPWIPRERILISICETHERIARTQLPEIPEGNFILEPVGRDTSACVGLCALHLERRDPEACMLAVPADHFIGDEEAYRTCLQRGVEHLEGATGIVFGVRPSGPDTSYGYIQARRESAQAEVWTVLKFVEKPDQTTAIAYAQSGEHFWNSGMFLWRNRVLLDLFRQHMPKTYRGLVQIREILGRDDPHRDLARIFSGLERISLDYGIMQKASGFRMIPVDFDWDDIGSWSALGRALVSEPGGNVSHGPHVSIDSTGCTVYSDAGVIATFGVSDLIIVQANGKVLVCPKEKAGELKRVVGALDAESE